MEEKITMQELDDLIYYFKCEIMNEADNKYDEDLALKVLDILKLKAKDYIYNRKIERRN